MACCQPGGDATHRVVVFHADVRAKPDWTRWLDASPNEPYSPLDLSWSASWVGRSTRLFPSSCHFCPPFPNSPETVGFRRYSARLARSVGRPSAHPRPRRSVPRMLG